MKKLIVLTLLSAFAAFGAFGKGARTGGDEGFSGDFVFGGSTTVEPVALSAIEAFEEMHPNARITYDGTGSSTGVKNALSGVYLIGGASRELKQSEIDEGAVAIPIALDGIAVVVNNNVPIDNLTVEQVAKIFSGEYRSWKDVGGPDKTIVVVNRDEASGTRAAFLELALDAYYGSKEGEFIADAITTESNGNMVSMVGATPDAVGYCGLGYLDDARNAGAKEISVDGMDPSVDNVLAGKYPVSRKLNLVTKGEPKAGSIEKAFIDFLLSDEGQAIVDEEGYISLP